MLAPFGIHSRVLRDLIENISLCKVSIRKPAAKDIPFPGRISRPCCALACLHQLLRNGASAIGIEGDRILDAVHHMSGGGAAVIRIGQRDLRPVFSCVGGSAAQLLAVLSGSVCVGFVVSDCSTTLNVVQVR